MENYSSKICTKCYTVQEPAARFCDNCGKAFAATAATDGNISIVTKTFLKRQVAETRPLFWLCIIIVGMLGVFGFAQAGLYLAKPADSGAAIAPKPSTLLSREAAETGKPQTTEEVARPADTLDLNESVFEMRDGGTNEVKHGPARKTLVSPRAKPETAKSEAKETTAAAVEPERTEPPAVQPDAPVAKPAEKQTDTAAAPRKFLRGPMGGCYYISASGSKRYVDRGLCS